MRWSILLVALLAGCAGTAPLESQDDGHGGHGNHNDGEEGRVMPGPGALTLEVLSPGDTTAVGETEVQVRVTMDGLAITDAEVRLQAWMVEHGHGCGCIEVDPTHHGDGIYRGATDLFMKGEWDLRLGATWGDETGATTHTVTVS